MKKIIPARKRRPSGLQSKVQQALTGAALGAGLTAIRVRGHIDPERENDPAVATFLAARPSVPPEWVVFSLDMHEHEVALRQELAADIEAVDRANAEQAQAGTPRTISTNHDFLRELDAAAQRLTERYVFSTFRDEFYDLCAEVWMSGRALDIAEARHMPADEKGSRPSPLSVWKTDPRGHRVISERYFPGRTERIVTEDGKPWLNIWRPSNVRPIDGDCLPVLEHVIYLCNGNERYAGHLLDWMAYVAQNPGKKVLHTPLIISDAQGVGKDTVYLLLRRVLGEHNCTQPEDDAVVSGRHHYMKAAQLVAIGEVMCGEKRVFANKLKVLITQPEIEINEKNVKPYTVVNNTNFILFSNNKNAAYIEDNDRRYFVIICDQGPRPVEAIRALYADFVNGPKIAHFAHFLMTRDLSKFDPYAPAMDTEHKAVVKRTGHSEAEKWLTDAFESRDAPFDRDIINIRAALNLIAETCKRRSIGYSELTSFLAKVGGGDLGKPRVSPCGKQQIRVWAVRDHAELSRLPVAVLRECYLRGEAWQDVLKRIEEADSTAKEPETA